MEMIRQIALYTGGVIVAIAAFHIFVLTFMVLTIWVSPQVVQHIAYRDNLLEAVIELLQ